MKKNMTKKLVNLTKDSAPRNFAVVVNGDDVLSEQVQKFLFENLGARWGAKTIGVVDHTNQDVIYVEWLNSRGHYSLFYSDLYYYQTGDVKVKFPPVFITTETKVVLKYIKIEAETVEINGKLYLEHKVAEALRDQGVEEI